MDDPSFHASMLTLFKLVFDQWYKAGSLFIPETTSSRCIFHSQLEAASNGEVLRDPLLIMHIQGELNTNT